MNIRTRLTIRFILIVVVIILLASVLIYLFSANYRQEEFYNRLQNKANNTAKILIEVDEIDANLLMKLEDDNPVSLPNEKIVIFNYRNEILFSTDKDQTIKIDTSLLDRIRLEDQVRFSQGQYEVLGFLFKGTYDRFAVVAAATDIYGFNKLKNLRSILLIVSFISIVIASISGWFFSGKALQPISNVVRQVDEISITSLNLRVAEGNGKDEIAHLANTFNRMLERLETSFKVQKNFIANASHELRTPLTAITGQLEVTLLSERSRLDYENVINSVLDDIRALNRLSNRLLLLAQTSFEGLETKLTKIRIDELVWQTREEMFRHNPSYIVKIDLDENLDDETNLTIRGDEQLIKTLLYNIIENGCKYSKDHSINIRIESSRSGVTLTFKDNGIGIAQDEQENIFEPFYRGKNALNTKGHGIGLSMVKRIATLHNATIKLTSAPGSGTTISVNFPFAEA